MDSMHQEDGLAMFAFQDLHYIPFGYGTTEAPYIETGSGTMRAAAALMHLDLPVLNPDLLEAETAGTVVCDLGCGDGCFLISLLAHINLTTNTVTSHGIGVDYDAELIRTATVNSIASGSKISWLLYDFNTDLKDLACQLEILKVTHVFIYLVPKQLALPIVKGILTKLYENGVMLCAYKFYPNYLTSTSTDSLSQLMVYQRRF